MSAVGLVITNVTPDESKSIDVPNLSPLEIFSFIPVSFIFSKEPAAIVCINL